MISTQKLIEHKFNRELIIAVFIICAAIINIIETSIPKPIPWLRFGLSNIFILNCIVLMGWEKGAVVAAGKVVVAGIALGTLFSPTFFMAAAGTTLSVIVMAGAWKMFNRIISPVGVSILGSVAHNLGQLTIILIIMHFHKSIFFQLPIIILVGSVSGFITGIISLEFIKKWEAYISMPPKKE
ncbi:MAG TPA: Gx transporter family protein [Firmicutes bacterium]|nr:Gx transporter family protein [Bacillota bacterium]